MPPSFFPAVGLGLRAAAREAWLVPVGALLAGARRAATWPAWAVLVAVAVEAALSAAAAHPLDGEAPVRGALAALGSARVAALVLGLWLAGALLGAALRVAWLAGALSTLGAALGGGSGERRFATAIAYALPRVLAAAGLALAADVGAALFAIGLALAALRAASVAHGSVLLAAAVALALTLAVLVPLAMAGVSDAAVARAALRGEGPARAFAGAVRRFLARPGTFVLASLAFAVAAGLLPLSLEGVGSVALGFAGGVDPLLLLGPNLMLGAAALVLGAALDLWWLGTVSALACSE